MGSEMCIRDRLQRNEGVSAEAVTQLGGLLDQASSQMKRGGSNADLASQLSSAAESVDHPEFKAVVSAIASDLN